MACIEDEEEAGPLFKLPHANLLRKPNKEQALQPATLVPSSTLGPGILKIMEPPEVAVICSGGYLVCAYAIIITS